MKKVSISSKTLEPLFDRFEKLSKTKRILIFVLPFVLIIGAFVGALFYPKYTNLTQLKGEHEQLENELRIATIKAAKLNRLREELAAAQKDFKLAGKALPEKEEIPSLLASISQSGQDSGLEFLLFQPNPEVNKEFYAEIPVSITVEGTYHDVGTFFDRVSNLSRIVNVENVAMKPAKGEESDLLTMSCTAVTYKFVEAEQTEPKTKKKS
jgi:type IV pilus assembly protein PilO